MIPHPPHRQKAGGPLLGATEAGQEGPFGEYDDGDQAEPDVETVNATVPSDRDAELLAAVSEAAEQRAAERVARFRERRRAAAERREQLWRARQAGLGVRHAARLRHLADDDGDQDDGPDGQGHHDDRYGYA